MGASRWGREGTWRYELAFVSVVRPRGRVGHGDVLGEGAGDRMTNAGAGAFRLGESQNALAGTKTARGAWASERRSRSISTRAAPGDTREGDRTCECSSARDTAGKNAVCGQSSEAANGRIVGVARTAARGRPRASGTRFETAARSVLGRHCVDGARDMFRTRAERVTSEDATGHENQRIRAEKGILSSWTSLGASA